MTDNPGIRKVWFVTRPMRDPAFHQDALQALDVATNHFTLKWDGNRELQKQYEKVLNTAGLKRKNISKDGSGGRTWAAMLRTYSYVYLDKDGYLKLTNTGAGLLSGKDEREIVKKQLLTLQIPNAYFLDKGFRPKYDSRFRIFPVRFLLKVLNHKELDYYLTREEIVYFVMPTQKNEDLEEVVQTILRFRKYEPSLKDCIISNIENEYEHRSRSDHESRTYYEANSDVAHTFMLLAEYAGGVTYQRGDSIIFLADGQAPALSALLDEYDRKYPFRNPERYSSLDLLAQATGLSRNKFKFSPYFGIKPATNLNKRIIKAKNILAEIPNASELDYNETLKILSDVFTEDESKRIIAEIDLSDLTYAEDNFAQRYLHETSNRQFEDDTGKLLEAIGFRVIMRPQPVLESRTNIEILAKYTQNEYCIFDAKNYSNQFQLSSGIRSIMHSEYIPNYDNYDGGMLTHYGYVTAGKFSGDKFLTEITEKSKRTIPNREITGVIISAKALLGYLDYCKMQDIGQKERLNIFVDAIQNKGYSMYQEVINATHNS